MVGPVPSSVVFIDSLVHVQATAIGCMPQPPRPHAIAWLGAMLSDPFPCRCFYRCFCYSSAWCALVPGALELVALCTSNIVDGTFEITHCTFRGLSD